MSDCITGDHIKRYFEERFKVPVTKINVTQDKPTVVWGDEIFQRGLLKSCFRLGMNSRQARYRKINEEEYRQN